MSLTAGQARSTSAFVEQLLSRSALQTRQLGIELPPVDASGPILAAAVFLLTVAFGGVILRRSSGWVDEAVEASMAHPLRSLLYGFVAYAITIFVVGYAVSQLSRLGVDARILAFGGGGLIALVLLSFGGVGFAVVGAWLTELLGERDPWSGLVGVAAVSAVSWVLLPAGVALLLWLGVAAIGLGGPTRRWIREPDVDPRRRR